MCGTMEMKNDSGFSPRCQLREQECWKEYMMVDRTGESGKRRDGGKRC